MVCNTGVSWTPIIDGKRYTFTDAGIYNGLALMRDFETSSLWHHITGECIDGVFAGAFLGDEYPLQYLTVSETVKRYPQAVFPVKVELKWWQRALANLFRRTMWTDTNGMIPPIFRPFMPVKDTRLPELEVGLGIKHKEDSRFYRLSTIKANNHAMLITLAGEKMILFIDPYSNAPIAICTDANDFHWDGNTLVLDNGTKIEHGSLKAPDGSASQLDYPHQVFTRWYGFSYTYPDCDVFTLDDKVDAKVDDKAAAKVDAKVDDKVDAKVDDKAAAKVDDKVDDKAAAKVDAK